MVRMSQLFRTGLTLGLLSCVVFTGNACSSGSSGGGTAGTTGNTGGDDGGVGGSGAGGSSNAGTTNTAGNAGTAGTGVIPGAGIGGNPTDGEIGARCESNADCRPELTCLSSSMEVEGGVGSVPGGWCTLPCAASEQNRDCEALSALGACVLLNDNGTPNDITDDTGYCTERCLFGSPLDATENKCHQRLELQCVPYDGVTATEGWCLAGCANDTQCAEGQGCDLNTGFCVTPPPTGDAIGTACDPAAATDTCQGFCAEFAEGVGFCSGLCTFGALGCGVEVTADEPVDAFCLPVLDSRAYGFGDVGVCFEGCDCNDECSSPDNLCLPLGDPELEAVYGHVGVCFPPNEATPGDAGADAGADPFVVGIACP
jgi:hypothetical protein